MAREPAITADEALRLLEAERAQVNARLWELEEELEGIVQSAVGANLDDEHDPEGATVAFERARITALRDEARRHLSAIERAGEQVSAGTFGRCTSCGGVIEPERLRVRPTADRCVGCA